MLTWLVPTPKLFVRLLLSSNMFAKFYQFESVVNSNAEFGRRVLNASWLLYPGATPLGWVAYTPETGLSPVDELNSNPDTFPLQ